jgi:hypothetical protein
MDDVTASCNDADAEEAAAKRAKQQADQFFSFLLWEMDVLFCEVVHRVVLRGRES